MADKKVVKVKALADKYGVSVKEIIKELETQGFAVKNASSVIPADAVDLVEAFFDDLAQKRDKAAKEQASGEAEPVPGGVASGKEVHIKSPVIVKQLAEALGRKPNEIISGLISMNVLASINQAVDSEVAVRLCKKFGVELLVDKREKDEHLTKTDDKVELSPEELDAEEDDPAALKPRAPIVTFMGHVDHGKTSLQDAIRKTDVAGGEAGGITQHIGASTVSAGGKSITFIDTPGHEAFTAMRARGADVTDIVVLVVAANDGFMPQTVEALSHAKAAKVPIIVAINKVDLPDANPDKVLLNMQQHGLMPEDWGGEIGAIRVSAKSRVGIDTLLERILLEAEMLELKANPSKAALAYVLESQLEQGFGPTASIVVKNGTLKVGDPIICGEYYGKVKSLIDYHGKRIRMAGPSTPVKLVGLNGVPEAGCKLAVCKSEREARELAEARLSDRREETLSIKVQGSGASLEDLFNQKDSDERRNNLKIVLKADVKGSCEAIAESLRKLPSDKINVDILFSGVGAITENDVMLASSAGAIVVGFHVRVNPGVNALSKKERVEIRLYSIIYELVEDITDALLGRLAPDKREKELGSARILKIFTLTKGPKVCGCIVEKGSMRIGAKARIYRKGELIFNGEIRSLRHFQSDVKEVKQGLECGIKMDNFLDFVEDDVITAYEIELKKATLV